MKKIHVVIMVLLILASSSCTWNKGSEVQNELKGPRKVQMKKNGEGNYRLFIDGAEFYVMGAGLEFGEINNLANHGANSFRTWRTDNGQNILDKAEELDLMVLMGIEVGRERQGYDYDDDAWVAKQKEEIREQVLQFKDHPALLGWGVGNELNLKYSNKKVWDAVNDISKMIHEIDGNHPTTTMLSGISKEEIDYMSLHCADLDFISIQMYGDIINLRQRLDEAGYEGPFLVTEWGATGHWEVPETTWGAPIEENSTQKAKSIKERYEKAILTDQVNCLGSYVFLWGQKQERTPTWYGLFTEDDEETGAIDQMHYYWNNNNYPENRSPELSTVKLNSLTALESIEVSSNELLSLTYSVTDPDGDKLSTRFEVLHESTDLGEGGDMESRPASVDDLLISKEEGNIVFKAPKESGAFRVYLYILDGNNNSATVNIPFLVK